MRTVIIAIAITLLVLIMTAVAGVSLLHTPWFLNVAKAQLTETVGQEVEIDSLDVDLGRILTIRIKNASVANPSWASSPFLASVEALEMGIDLFELLGGQLVVTKVQAREPEVHLERSAEGTKNWAGGSDVLSTHDGQTLDHHSEENPALNLPRIESLVVTDGQFTFSDPAQKTLLSLSIESEVGTHTAGTGRLMADGGGKFSGQPLHIGLIAGIPPEFVQSGKKIFPLEIRIDFADTHVLVEGRIDAMLSPKTANLDIIVTGQNLSRWNEPLNMELPALPAYELLGQLTLSEGVWSLNPMKAIVGNNEIAGSLQLGWNFDPLRIEGELHSNRLDLPELQSYLPPQQDSTSLAEHAANFLNALANKTWQAKLHYHADLIETGSWPIHDVEIGLTLKEKTFTVESLSGATGGIPINAKGYVSANQEPAEGRMQVQIGTAGLPDKRSTAKGLPTESKALLKLPGNLNGEFAIQVQALTVPIKEQMTQSKDDDSPHRVRLTSIDIQNFHIAYADPSSDTNIRASLDEEKSNESLTLNAEGHYHNNPIQLTLNIPGLESLTAHTMDWNRPQRLAANLQFSGTTTSVAATILPAWPPTHMDIRVVAESETLAATAAIWGLDIPPLNKIALKGSLTRRGSTWHIKEFYSHFGKSSIVGKATIDTADEVRFETALQSTLLDVASLSTIGETNHAPSDSNTSDIQASNSPTGFSKEIFIPQWLGELNGRISVDVQHLILPHGTLEDVSLLATIDDNRLRLAPLSLELGGGLIETSAILNLAVPSIEGQLQTTIHRVDLNEAMQAFGRDATDLGTVGGRIALHLPATRESLTDPFTLDNLMERMRIKEIRLQYDDPALEAKTDLRLKADTMISGMTITGTVEYRDRSVDISLATGSLRKAFEDYRSMGVDATFQVKETTLGITGTVEHLLPLANFTGTVTAEGPNPARLGNYLGIPLPDLPPYRLQAQLHRQQGPEPQQRFIFKGLGGTIGDSDVAGTLEVTTGGERPEVFARLRSQKLDLDDLAGLIGAQPDPEETVSPRQRRQAEAVEDRKLFLPDEPIDFTQLRKVNADVEYRATHVQAPDLPLDDFFLNMRLQNGHLKIDRLNFGVATGTMAMKLEVNARELPVHAKLTTDFDRVKLSELLARYEFADDAFGYIGGQGTLWMQGESLAKWFASADGGLYLTMTGGQLDALLIELAGLDFVESAAVFLGTEAAVPIDCAYTDLQARSGMVTIRPLVFDTQDTKFKGSGTIDLRQEHIKLTVHPYPQDFSLLSSRGPLHVTGTFQNPGFRVDPSFPFPEFGTADNSVRCFGMIEALREARKNSDNPAVFFEAPK